MTDSNKKSFFSRHVNHDKDPPALPRDKKESGADKSGHVRVERQANVAKKPDKHKKADEKGKGKEPEKSSSKSSQKSKSPPKASAPDRQAALSDGRQGGNSPKATKSDPPVNKGKKDEKQRTTPPRKKAPEKTSSKKTQTKDLEIPHAENADPEKAAAVPEKAGPGTGEAPLPAPKDAAAVSGEPTSDDPSSQCHQIDSSQSQSQTDHSQNRKAPEKAQKQCPKCKRTFVGFQGHKCPEGDAPSHNFEQLA